MKYYVIKPSLDKKIIGHYPQSKDVKHNCHVWDEPKFIGQVHFKKIDFTPITSNTILYSSSKVTDLIDANGSMGFNKKLLVSTKLKKVLETYRSSGMQFFKSPIIYKNELIDDYWILNMYEIDMNFIDFKNSNFVFRKRKQDGGSYLESVPINSYEQFKMILSKKGELNYTQFFVEKIKLTSNITKDFFALLHVNGGVKYIVSEKLKKEIEDIGCIGIELMPVELTLNEWLFNEREKIYGKA